jgi:hypothetical protein
MPQVGRLKNVGTYSIFFCSIASLYSHQPRFGQWNMIHRCKAYSSQSRKERKGTMVFTTNSGKSRALFEESRYVPTGGRGVYRPTPITCGVPLMRARVILRERPEKL